MERARGGGGDEGSEAEPFHVGRGKEEKRRGKGKRGKGKRGKEEKSDRGRISDVRGARGLFVVKKKKIKVSGVRKVRRCI